jgi:hypothetical protein
MAFCFTFLPMSFLPKTSLPTLQSWCAWHEQVCAASNWSIAYIPCPVYAPQPSHYYTILRKLFPIAPLQLVLTPQNCTIARTKEEQSFCQASGLLTRHGVLCLDQYGGMSALSLVAGGNISAGQLGKYKAPLSPCNMQVGFALL